MIKWNYIKNWSIQIQESTFENVVKMRKIKQQNNSISELQVFLFSNNKNLSPNLRTFKISLLPYFPDDKFLIQHADDHKELTIYRLRTEFSYAMWQLCFNVAMLLSRVRSTLNVLNWLNEKQIWVCNFDMISWNWYDTDCWNSPSRKTVTWGGFNIKAIFFRYRYFQHKDK